MEIIRGDIVLGSKCWVKEENLFLLVYRVIFFFTFAFIIVIAHFNSAFNSACSVKIHLRIKIIHIYTKVTKLIFCS